PPGDVVTVGLWRVKGEAIATVSDNGPGIPPENLETVFERFYTSRPKGAAFGGNSGLGLSIARQIAQAHGGTLRAENRTGADGKVLGAMFTLILPESGP
ncbi:MAG: histidine kinase, partial [Phenylobacterium sp.]|uniref:sensor histidine kinase n=1 Tax=Phenylobacterium sp. TaxID=1871053 RepID=UPI001A506B97